MAGFSFGNIIYLILIAAFAIYSSQKKKRRNPSDSSNRTQKPSFFEDLLSGGQLNMVPEPNVIYEDDEDQDRFEFEEEQKPIVKEDTNDLESLIKDSPEEDFYMEVKEDNRIEFDLRQAVIYSEILKRKYF